jgi:predicted transcriptional regulator
MKTKSIQLSPEAHHILENMAGQYATSKKIIAEDSIRAISKMGVPPNEVKRNQIAEGIKRMDENHQKYIKHLEQNSIAEIYEATMKCLSFTKASYDHQLKTSESFGDLLKASEIKINTLHKDLKKSNNYHKELFENSRKLYDGIQKEYPGLRKGKWDIPDSLREFLSVFMNDLIKIYNAYHEK